MNASNRINRVLFLSACLGGIQGANAFENVVCVTTPAEFQTALTNAETATLPTVIEVTAGMYLIGSTLTYEGTTSNALTIRGGYSGSLVHGLCSAQAPDPALTVLDAQQLHGLMFLSTTDSAPITVEYLTFQNGLSDTIRSAALEVISDDTGAINIGNNVFSANVLQSEDSRLVLIENSGELNVLNNAFVNNSLMIGIGLVIGSNGSSATTTVNNNTVSGNSCSAPSGSSGFAASFYSTSTLNIFNNIFYGNSNCAVDLYLQGTSSTAFYLEFNDLDNVRDPASGEFAIFAPSNNFSETPGFVGNGSYQLAGDSPLVDAGSNSASGGVGTLDVAGQPRVVAIRSSTATVDIGAYELQDDIFKSGFE
jgi:hypothetical protein